MLNYIARTREMLLLRYYTFFYEAALNAVMFEYLIIKSSECYNAASHECIILPSNIIYLQIHVLDDDFFA